MNNIEFPNLLFKRILYSIYFSIVSLGSKLSASAQEFVPGGAGMPNGGAMDAYQSQFRFNVGAAEFTPTGQTVQPNAGSSGS